LAGRSSSILIAAGGSAWRPEARRSNARKSCADRRNDRHRREAQVIWAESGSTLLTKENVGFQ
jgi:hypothetical protein